MCAVRRRPCCWAFGSGGCIEVCRISRAVRQRQYQIVGEMLLRSQVPFEAKLSHRQTLLMGFKRDKALLPQQIR